MSLSLDRSFHRAALAAVVLALFWIPSTATRVLAVFLAAGVLPGAAIASRARLAGDAALGIALSLSPVIFAVMVLGAMFAGAGLPAAASIASRAGLVLFVALGGRPRTLPTPDRRALGGAILVLVAAGVLAFSLPLAETWWRVREDSWFHAAVANKLARDGLPLTDPYFANLRIQYMYAYHAVVGASASLARVDYFHAMILVNAMALSSAVVAFHALAGCFARRAGPRILATCLWVFGLNGWFYFSYPERLARAAVGETRGVEALRNLFAWTPPGHATAVSLLSVDGNQFMFLDKFMIGTALSLTFGLAATVVLLLVHARRGEWSLRHDAAFVLSIAGAMLLHLVVGVTVAVVTAVVLACLLVIRSQPSPGGPSYARLVGWIALALAAVAPYVASVAPRGAGSTSVAFALQRAQTTGVLFGVLPALVLAAVFLRGASRDTPESLGARVFADLNVSATGVIVLWTLLVVAVALSVDLVTNNETKFAFLVHLPLAALAAGALERWWDSPRARRAAVALVASATVPLHAVYFVHAFRDRSAFEASDAERAVYRWLEARAPADAVVLEENDVVRVPVLASRDSYWGTEGYARNWGYSGEEMDARRQVRDAVFSREGPGEVDLIRLRALDRPVLVVYRRHADDVIDAHERFEHDGRFRGRFATPDIAVWEIVLDEETR